MRAVHNPLIVLAILSLFAGCQGGGKTDGDTATKGPAPKLGSGEGDAKVLAVIDDQGVTVKDFKDRMNRQSPYIRARYNTPQKKKEFLDNMIRFELQAREASRRGLDEHPDVVRTMKQVMIQKLTKEIFESKLKPDDIQETEIEQYYKDHERDYNKPEMVRASHIFFKVADFKDAKAKAAAKKKANDALRQLRGKKSKPEVFSELAKKLSEDPRTKNRGGDLGYFARAEDGGTQEKPVADAAFALAKVNDLSGIIEGKGGFHILRLTAKRKAIEKTLDQVKPTIRSTLYRKKRKQMFKDFIEDLRGKANIQIDEALLGAIEIEGVKGPKPAGPRPPRPGQPTPLKPGTPTAPGKPAIKVQPAPAPAGQGAKAVKPAGAPKAPAAKAKVAQPPVKKAQ